MTGAVLGNYEILEKLGEGGMGEVWRARDRRLERLVAVKILPREVAADPIRRARFEQEARALGALNHPNVMAIFDIGEDGGRAYIVSELVEGESLRAMLERGPLPVRKAIEIAGQMAEGISAAHALGIVHRDLKPENVKVSPKGQAKLLDFGLAKQNTPTGENSATVVLGLSEPGMVMGTVGYMSPEQVRGEPADARSDIFSFGCVLYEMVTGQRAFDGPSGVETMHAILHADPPEFRILQTVLPAALAAIVHRCLEKRPERRFQSAADLAFALRSANTNATGPQHPVEGSRAARKRWAWAAAGAAAAIALFAAGYAVRAGLVAQANPTFERITFRKGYVQNARFTPHSRNIVYQASWEGGEPHTYFAVPGSPESRDLEMPRGTLAALSPQDELALITGPFGAHSSGTLVRASISGGQTRPLLNGVLAADWAPDGSAMAVLRWVDGAGRVEYPAGKVLAPTTGWILGMLRVSPDGGRVAYASITNGTSIGLTVIDRDGKKDFLGTVSGQNISIENSSLCWNPRGTEIWFRSFDPSEPGIIYAVDMHGKRRAALRLPSQVKLWDISHNGELLLSTGSSELGILGKAPGDSAERDLSCLDAGRVAGISDDGQLIAANVTGEAGGVKGTVYLRKTDGSPAVRATDGHAYRLSPDGKWIGGYTPRADGSRRFVLWPTGPGEEFDLKTPKTGFAVIYGWLDGDGRYLVGGSLPGKKWQCFVLDANSGTDQPLCAEGSPDSLEYFISPDRKQVVTRRPAGGWVVYPVNGQPPRDVQGVETNEAVIGWREDNRSLYVRPAGGPDAIPVSIVDVTTGQRTPWKIIHPAQPVLEIRNPFITPNGQAYVYNYVSAQSDLYVARGVN